VPRFAAGFSALAAGRAGGLAGSDVFGAGEVFDVGDVFDAGPAFDAGFNAVLVAGFPEPALAGLASTDFAASRGAAAPQLCTRCSVQKTWPHLRQSSGRKSSRPHALQCSP